MGVVFGLMTLLNNELKIEVINLWNYLESSYGLKGVKSFSYPNISYTGGFCDDIEGLISILDSRLCPATFGVEVLRIDKFESPENTIFLKVDKTKELIELHKCISTVLNEAGLKTFNLYNTENWIPHITIAMKDIPTNTLNDAIEDLKSKEINFNKCIIDNLTLIIMNTKTGDYKIVKVWEFKK